MPDREQRHVDADITHPVQEEDHPEQKQEVVVSSHHVLGAEVRERDELQAGTVFQECLVAFTDAMRPSNARQKDGCKQVEPRLGSFGNGQLHVPGRG